MLKIIDFRRISYTVKDIIYKSSIEENKQEINCNLNMNRVNKKNAVRLTESDLHRIIRESVNNILTELDWKTYANAARKRYERDKTLPKYDKDVYPYDTKKKNWDSMCDLYDMAYDSLCQDYGDPNIGKFMNNQTSPESFRRGCIEKSHFDNGDYQYSKDKGWHLKNESLNRIVRESVNRVLRNR